MLDDNRASMKYQLSQAGIDNASPDLVNWMADRTTMGIWSTTRLQSQVAALADPYSVDTIDDELFEYMANESINVDHTRDKEDTVRGHLEEWLGPVYGDRNLSYQSIAAPWRTYSQGIWGAPIEDTDEVFQQVLRLNDPREAGKVLRKAGIDRGYDKTISDVVQGMQQGMKSNVRGAV